MRAGPLSNSKVIALLNRYFVPVYSSNETFGPGGSAPPEERAERSRIFNEFGKSGLGTGEVHVYILSPDGHPAAGLDIGSAMDTDKLVQALETTVQRLRTEPGGPVVKPTNQSVPPPCDADAMVLHLAARGSHQGSWREFPAENWVTLSRAEWSRLLPTSPVKPGLSWNIDKTLAAKLLTNFYPATEDTSSADRNRIDYASLTVTVSSLERGIARARLDGELKMKRSFYPGKDDNNFVNAVLTGYMDFEPDRQRIQTLRLVTKKATYADEDFQAALRSMPPEALESARPAF